MITKEDIKNLANLSRLDISEEEAVGLVPQIDSILEYVSQIESFNTEESSEVPVLRNVMREDKITNSSGEYTEDLLSNAPGRDGKYLKVKKIL